jgi:hypothetical protein
VHRYAPTFIFPSHTYVPGVNTRSRFDEPVAELIDPGCPDQNECLRIALDLLNHGYAWESHVYLEALWNAHGRAGSIADFLKGVIKVAAASVKQAQGQDEPARIHLRSAIELIQAASEREGNLFLGFDCQALISRIQRRLDDPEVAFRIETDWK